jgi:flagellar hook assembly protein FlgD
MLHVNTPNPFDNFTKIQYTMHFDNNVTVTIYNNVGQEIRRLASEPKTAGTHQLTWDGRDRYGRALPNGVYLLRCTVGDYSATQKLLILR